MDWLSLEWLMLLPVAFLLPLALAVWGRRKISPGQQVAVSFDMALPSKWAAELTQRALSAEGRRSRVSKEGQLWLCSVERSTKYHPDAIEKESQHYEQVAAARGGQCLRYRVVRGKRVEERAFELSDSIL